MTNPKTSPVAESMVGLKPCPFCRTAPHVEPWDDGKGAVISCDNPRCVAQLEISESPVSSAIAYWNTRPIKDDILNASSASTDTGLVGELVKQARYIRPYLNWTIGAESPGHHPTMPSAVAAFTTALDALSKAKDTRHG